MVILDPVHTSVFLINSILFAYMAYLLVRKRPINRARKMLTIVIILAFSVVTTSFIRTTTLDQNVALVATRIIMSLSQLALFALLMTPLSLIKPDLGVEKIFLVMLPFLLIIASFWVTDPVSVTREGGDWSITSLNVFGFGHAIVLTAVSVLIALIFFKTYREVPKFRKKMRYILYGLVIAITLFAISFFIIRPFGSFMLILTPILTAITLFSFSLAFIDL